MTSQSSSNLTSKTWKEKWYEVIFEADTPGGKLFDVLLLVTILLSVLVIMLESVETYRRDYRQALRIAEWIFTIVFTAEFAARIACAPRPWRYLFSFWGVVDLLAILPTYLLLFFMMFYFPEGNEISSAHGLTIVRVLRLFRAFRIFKLAHMLSEATALREAIWAARAKIAVFLAFILISVVVVGSTMYVVEGPERGFDSIPHSMYWAVVTMTTVGYGDIAPSTPLGRTFAAVMMVLGYSFIIVPTGIVSAELAQSGGKQLSTQVCPECMREGHDKDAVYCKYCGGKL